MLDWSWSAIGHPFRLAEVVVICARQSGVGCEPHCVGHITMTLINQNYWLKGRKIDGI